MRQQLPNLSNAKTTSNSSWPAAETLAYSPQQMLRCHRRRSNGVVAHFEEHAPQIIYMSFQNNCNVRKICEKLRKFRKRCVFAMSRDEIRNIIYGFHRLFDNCCDFLDVSW